MNRQDELQMRTYNCPSCIFCGTNGEILYKGLVDRLFGAPGDWNLKRCSNPECGLAWLDPMPSREDIGKAYKNYYTHHIAGNRSNEGRNNLLRQAYQLVKDGYLAQRFGYATARSAWQRTIGLLLYLLPARRASLDRSVMGLRAQPGGRLLDVGCGNGQLLTRLRALGWQVEGVEVDPAAVAQARASGLEVRLGSLEAQQYPPNHFDVITMSHVIEHVHDPAGLLRECRRVLHPGGRLVVTTPNLNSWGHRFFKDSWFPLDPPRHLYLFTFNSLQGVLKSSGFKVRSAATSGLSAGEIHRGSRAIARTGAYDLGSVPPRPDRLRAAGFYWREWTLLKFKPGLGEELILIGKK